MRCAALESKCVIVMVAFRGDLTLDDRPAQVATNGA